MKKSDESSLKANPGGCRGAHTGGQEKLETNRLLLTGESVYRALT
jgi:hypothetical protein